MPFQFYRTKIQGVNDFTGLTLTRTIERIKETGVGDLLQKQFSIFRRMQEEFREASKSSGRKESIKGSQSIWFNEKKKKEKIQNGILTPTPSWNSFGENDSGR